MAVIVTLWFVVTEPAVAVNVAVVADAGTVTDAATGRAVLLLDSDTTAPPAGAAAESVTVHVVPAPALRLVGAHATELKTVGAINDKVAVCDTPLYVPVMTAD